MSDAYTMFFSSYRAQPGFNIEHETRVLESYLEGTLTADEAAKQITAPASDRHQTPNNRVGKVWELLLACAEEVLAAQSQILDLFQAIFSLQKPEDKNSWDVDWSNEKQRKGLGWTLEGLHGCKFVLLTEFTKKNETDKREN